MQYSWPLSVSSYNLLDKLSVCQFILFNDKYTMGEKVEELEQKFSELTNSKALFVSSGSAANTLMFETWKQLNFDKFPRTVVIAPSTTWISSVSPAVMSGFKVEFCDINLADLSFHYEQLERLIVKLKAQNKYVIIYPTSLIGFAPDFARLQSLAIKYNCGLLSDNCESTLTSVNNQNICGLTSMSTTSTFFSHLCVSIEGGFLFCKNQKEYETAKMIRSHGMSRALDINSETRKKIESSHQNIDPRFLFSKMGTNLRNSEIHAFFGLRDFKRVRQNIEKRKYLYDFYVESLDKSKYNTVMRLDGDVPFCLPVVSRDKAQNTQIKEILESFGIETRPIIAYLPISPAFNYCKEEDYPNSNFLHNNGLYVGLHSKLKEKDIKHLTWILNSIH